MKMSLWPFGKKEQPALRSAGKLMSAAPYGESYSTGRYAVHDGEKFDGGMEAPTILLTDYWALRTRSANFFKRNQYGRGIIRRLVTNVINTGLSLECNPLEELIDSLSEDDAEKFAITVETKYEAWASLPDVCDYSRRMSFGQMQAAAYREALVCGDVLVIEHTNMATNLPCYELIDGSAISTPIGGAQATKNRIEYGVELDSTGAHVAYYIMQEDFTHKRIPARGKNGRLIAWLVYGSDHRHCDVRGEPILSLIMQGVSEIDKYRDSVQRKASVGALFSVFFSTDVDAKSISSKPITAGAQRRASGYTAAPDQQDYKFDISSVNPGVVFEQLPPGVTPHGFNSDSTDEKFGEFEGAMLNGMAWALEMPPSILKMVFDSSYSASRGEVKEFDLTMKRARNDFAEQFLKPAYRSWLLAMSLTGRIDGQQVIDSWRDPANYEEFSAWTNSCWYGVVKEAVDLAKEVSGREGLVRNGWSTNASVARQMTGSRFESNIRKVARENQKIADALRPELEMRKEFGDQAVDAVKAQAGLKLVANGDLDGKDNI